MKLAVLVKLNESNQELLDDLERLQPRARAERVRVLAMIGLMATKDKIAGPGLPHRQRTKPRPTAGRTVKPKG